MMLKGETVVIETGNTNSDLCFTSADIPNNNQINAAL